MALHAYWAHGTVGVSHGFQSSIELGGLAFTLPPSTPLGAAANIFFPLPTPVIVNGKRARLLTVYVLYELESKTSLGPIQVLDGQNVVGTCDPEGTGQTFDDVVAGPVNLTGVNCLDDLVDNRTRFRFEQEAPQVFFGLCLVVSVRMASGGKARFTSVGADYDI